MKKFFSTLLLVIAFSASAPVFSQNINILDASAKAGMTFYWDSLALSGILEKI